MRDACFDHDTLSESHEEQCPLHHADDGAAILAIVFAIIISADREYVGKDETRAFERNAMLGSVGGVLGVVSLKNIVVHKNTA
jgi:hypothetical protein